MSLILGDVGQQVFAYIGRPSQSALPFRDLIDSGAREVSSIIVELLNTDRDYRAELVPVSAPRRDTLFPHAGEITRLEGRSVGSSDDDWMVWTRVPYASWDGEWWRTGSREFATYGGTEGTHLVFSEDPAPYEFRALVEVGGVTLQALTDDTTLSALVGPLLFTRWALSAGASVDADKMPESWERQWVRRERQLRLDLPRLEQSWRRYLEGGRGEGVTYREPFNSRRDLYDGEYYMDGSGRFRTT
jgi:hypothetical protein